MLRFLKYFWGRASASTRTDAVTRFVPRFERLGAGGSHSVSRPSHAYQPAMERLEERLVPTSAGTVSATVAEGLRWAFAVTPAGDLGVVNSSGASRLISSGGRVLEISAGTISFPSQGINDQPICYVLLAGGTIEAYLPDYAGGRIFDLGTDPGITKILAINTNVNQGGVVALADANVWTFRPGFGWTEIANCGCVSDIGEGEANGTSNIYAVVGGNLWATVNSGQGGWSDLNNSGAITAVSGGAGSAFVLAGGDVYTDDNFTLGLRSWRALTGGAGIDAIGAAPESVGNGSGVMALVGGNLWYYHNNAGWDELASCACITEVATDNFGSAFVATGAGGLWQVNLAGPPHNWAQILPDGTVA